jgi:ubiquinone/menaquinone biosynthesis C-methylase UbiE
MNPILDRGIGPLSGMKVLDAGCGDGFYIPNILAKNPLEVCACDISPYLMRVVKEEHPQIITQEMDLTGEWKYPNEKFDVVVAYNVIMDLPTIDKTIMEMNRVLKLGGKAHVVMVHTLYNLFFNDIKAKEETLTQRLARYVKEEELFVDTIPGYDKFQVYRRPPQSYINAFSRHGFKIMEMKEVVIDEKVANNPKYAERMGAPLFMYFILQK